MIMEPKKDVKAEEMWNASLYAECFKCIIVSWNHRYVWEMMQTSIDPNESSREFQIAWWHQESLHVDPFIMLKQLLYCFMNKFGFILGIYLK